MASYYTVGVYNGRPSTKGDDLITYDEFDHKDEAISAYDEPEGYFLLDNNDGELWVEIISPDGTTKERLIRKSKRQRNDEWRREMAMEAGMLHGCDGYNEVMGY